MRRNVVFGKGRGWRPEDDRYQDLHLGPRRGATVGEYAPPEPNEYSDSYYAPASAYERRNFGSGGLGDEPARGTLPSRASSM